MSGRPDIEAIAERYRLHRATGRAQLLYEDLPALLAYIEAQEAELAALRAAPDAPDREALGRIVRDEWVRCATEHGDAPSHHLIGWDGLDERNKEIDRRIGEAVARAVAHPDARLREAAERLRDWHKGDDPDALCGLVGAVDALRGEGGE